MAAAARHAQAEHPREACGLVIVRLGKEIYQPCRNIAQSDSEFCMHPDDYAAAEAGGEVVAIVHSHPNAAPEPSEADRAACEMSGLPWHIVSVPAFQWAHIAPSGWRAPLIGREFHHGVQDCMTLIHDWFQVKGVKLPNPHRADNWWLAGGNLYLENYEPAGFSRVLVSDDIHPSELREGDVLLMHTAGSPVPNHGAIYLGDGTILHHQGGRLSTRDIFGGQYRKKVSHVLRHRALS